MKLRHKILHVAILHAVAAAFTLTAVVRDHSVAPIAAWIIFGLVVTLAASSVLIEWHHRYAQASKGVKNFGKSKR